MNRIIEILKQEIPQGDSRFVFPSETATSLWAQKICGILGLRSLARDRFLAWDRFKERIIRADVQNREPVAAVIRRLFALDLVRRNAQAQGAPAVPDAARMRRKQRRPCLSAPSSPPSTRRRARCSRIR